MAIDFSRYNFLKRLDARARIFVLIFAVIFFIILIYILAWLLGGGTSSTGPSRVANAPNVQSVPGTQLVPEYYRALAQANQQSAQQAQISGTSAVPTLINTGSSGCIICSDESANVAGPLDDMVKKGEITPDVAQELQALAAKNVPVAAYAQELQNLVKEGKLTPQQARQLLNEYAKQHAAALQNESAKAMDPLIQSGALPLDAANQLLADQRKGMTPAQYAQELQRLENEGRISPETAQKLLGQYTQQRAREITQESISILNQMARNGEITQDVLQTLTDAENKMIPLDDFSSTLDQLVAAGKMTPATSNKILTEYNSQKTAIGPNGALSQLIQQAESEAFQEIADLLKAGKISKDVGTLLENMIQRNVSEQEFESAISQLVQQGKLSPDIAKLKIADYHKIKTLRDLQGRLAKLQANNASPDDYANELKKDVAAGLLTPEQAAQLMKEYMATKAQPSAPVIATPTNNPAFAQLQQRALAGQPQTPAAVVSPAEFAVARDQTNEAAAQDIANRISAIQSAMASQAQQLIVAWAPPTMEFVPGEAQTVAAVATTTTTTTGAGGLLSATASGPPLIKAGTVLFAVLDTAVNSDFKTSPVMATIVQGPFKGAKLLGTLTTATNPAGQLDRIGLNFTLMNMPQWTDAKSINAFAIDPDTARAVFASHVDNHYFKRFGAIMATSFLQGFGNAIATSGSTTTTGIFGTSTTKPVTSTAQNIWQGIGQVGTTLSSAIQPWINIPPTVKVDPGVGLGILFMADVTQ